MTTSAPRSSKSDAPPPAPPGLEAAAFAVFLAVAVLPIAASLAYSFLYTIGLAGLLQHGLTAATWVTVLSSRELWKSLGLSVAVAATVCALAAGGGLLLALALRRQLSRGPLSYAIYLPLALPGTVAAFLGFQILSPAGLLSRLAYRLGVTGSLAAFPALTNDRWAIGIVATEAGLALPFFALLFAQLYESERVADFDALSRTLGASRAQSFWRVAVPLLLDAGASNVLLLFVAALGAYEVPLLLGRQSPQMLSVLAMQKFQRFDLSQKPQAFVIAILYTALSLGVIQRALAHRRRRGRLDLR